MKKVVQEISKIKLKPIVISDDGLHLHVRVKLNGKAVWMMLDTGASNTVFDITKIEKLLQKKTRKVNGRYSTGLGASEIPSHKVKIDTLELGNIHISKQSFTCLDLSHLNMSYSSLEIPHVVGVVGSDLLYAFGVSIDYRKMQLLFFEPNEDAKAMWKNIKLIKQKSRSV